MVGLKVLTVLRIVTFALLVHFFQITFCLFEKNTNNVLPFQKKYGKLRNGIKGKWCRQLLFWNLYVQYRELFERTVMWFHQVSYSLAVKHCGVQSLRRLSVLLCPHFMSSFYVFVLCLHFMYLFYVFILCLHFMSSFYVFILCLHFRKNQQCIYWRSCGGLKNLQYQTLLWV